MNKNLPHHPSSLIDLCQKVPDRSAEEQVRQIKSKDFDNTPEAKALSNNFAGFEVIIHALGITKPRLEKYCRIVIALAKGKTSRFECSDVTVGARYYNGDGWVDLTENDIGRCSKQGARLNRDLVKICPDLIVRHASRGDKPTELEVPLINIILRVCELIKLRYSAKEAVGLLDIKPAKILSPKRSKRSAYSKLKQGMTLIDQALQEDPKLIDQLTSIPPMLIHGNQKGQPLYRKVGIREYELQLKDDESKKIVKRVRNGNFNALIREAESKGLSLVLSHAATNIIQLDDCDPNVVLRIQPYCFEVVETSAHNYHCRLALPIGTGQKQTHSVRDRLLNTLRSVGSCNAGGGKSFRLPGSTNFKAGRGNKVVQVHAQEKVTSILELNMAGLIPYEYKAKKMMNSIPTEKKWPDYDRVKTYKDHSNSAKDFNWARQGASWGMNRNQLMEGLKVVSPTATKKGEKYVERTVERAIQNSRRWKSTPTAAAGSRLTPTWTPGDESFVGWMEWS